MLPSEVCGCFLRPVTILPTVAMIHSTTGAFSLSPPSPNHQSPGRRACPQPPCLPLPAATKADQYVRLRRFDRGILRRPGAQNTLRAPVGVAMAQRKMEGVKVSGCEQMDGLTIRHPLQHTYHVHNAATSTMTQPLFIVFRL